MTGLILDGRDIDLTIGDLVTGGDVEQTIEGASTLTLPLRDDRRRLLASGLLDHDENGRLDADVDLRDDDTDYRLAAVTKQGDSFTMVFEDLTIAKLRRVTGALRVNGTDDTAFLRRLAHEIGALVIVPTGEALAHQASKGKQDAERAKRDQRRERGIADNAKLNVKGARASSAQLRVAETLLSVAQEMNASPKATLALIEAGIVESELTNSGQIGDPGSTSVGVLQAQYGVSRGYTGATMTRGQCLDVAYCARSFLGKIDEQNGGFASRGSARYLAKAHPDWTAGHIAAEVEAPAAQFRGRYDQVAEEARAIIAAYGGTDSTAGGTTGSLSRGTADNPEEDSWEAMKRTAQSLGKRLFVVRGDIYYAREQDLILSRPRMTLSEATPGVDVIDWEWVPRKPVNTATIVCQAGMWAAPPGSVVILEDSGPADGRWLVSSFRRPRYQTTATVELRRGTELLRPEPKTTGTSTATTASSSTRSTSSSRSGQLSGIDLDERYEGTQAIIERFVTPFMKTKGLAPGSAKRTPAQNAAVGGSATSDHLTTSTSSYATDYPTGDGEKAARALARAMGNPHWQPNSYAKFTIRVGNREFVVQILWGAGIQHGDHVHVGVRAA